LARLLESGSDEAGQPIDLPSRGGNRKVAVKKIVRKVATSALTFTTFSYKGLGIQIRPLCRLGMRYALHSKVPDCSPPAANLLGSADPRRKPIQLPSCSWRSVNGKVETASDAHDVHQPILLTGRINLQGRTGFHLGANSHPPFRTGLRSQRHTRLDLASSIPNDSVRRYRPADSDAGA
jgi:hypothetical protein